MSDDDASDQDDDWFESALRDDEDDERHSSDDGSPFDDDSGGSVFADEDTDEGSPFDETDGDAGSDSPFSEGDFSGDADESPFDDEDGGSFGGGGDSAFEDEGGDSAFGDESGGSPFEDEGGGSAFGDEGGGSAFEESDDEAADDDDGSLFEDDFSSAMESVGGGFGGGGGDGGAFGGGGSEEFDDDEFESDIPRLDLGIEGLDNMIQGGIPRRHLMVAIGGPGTGKTTLGLQFLYHGLAEADDNAVFITLEQTYDDIMATANEHDWEFDRYEDENRLAVVDLDPVEMANSLDNIRGELPRLIRDFGADRFVLDSVSLLEMMYDNQAQRRTEVFDFTQSLKNAGVTTLFTSEADDDNPYSSRHGIIEYLTDAVFVLQYVRGEATATRTAIEIQKIRNANHSRETKPYDITLDGIDVYEQADIF